MAHLKSKVRDSVAIAVGMKHTTLTKAREVVEAAREDPKRYGDLVEQMDHKGNVSKAYKELKRRKAEAGREKRAKKIPAIKQVVCMTCEKAGSQLAKDSADLIFTDPPYLKAAIEAYSDLGKLAAKVLRPGGICMAYTGHYVVGEAWKRLETSLTPMWVFFARNMAGQPRFRKYHLFVGTKPILAFYKPPLEAWWQWFGDTVGGGKEKDWHEWQQAEGEAAYFIEHLSPKQGLIVDPFCGSGTTLMAAKKLGRKYWGCDSDKAVVSAANLRLAGA